MWKKVRLLKQNDLLPRCEFPIPHLMVFRSWDPERVPSKSPKMRNRNCPPPAVFWACGTFLHGNPRPRKSGGEECRGERDLCLSSRSAPVGDPATFLHHRWAPD